MRSQILAAVLLSALTLRAAGIVVAHRKGCLGLSGPGSPPCARSYRGSGHVATTQKPAHPVLPTPGPAGGSLYPACSCPGLPADLFPPIVAAPAPAPEPPTNPWRPHLPPG